MMPRRDFTLFEGYPTFPRWGMSGDPLDPMKDVDPTGLEGGPLIEYLWHAQLYRGVSINWKQCRDGELFLFKSMRTSLCLQQTLIDAPFPRWHRRSKEQDPRWERSSSHKITVLPGLHPGEVPDLSGGLKRYEEEIGGIPIIHLFFRGWSARPPWSHQHVGAIGVCIGSRL